ncbi:hypothetical protein L207DRAFT_636629 [Hyaloscypha variabilis F]|uniref:Uncharacterized protein n=1 Tax=Hyaloscypha variabilis (strain UAMH 11265 / GT02V1 / F) TaxID=1149755 RepID=A0A2J6RDS7_HYAVF|nr:hypothetical protein L207DRAFT_636629 [Hyaloscypha variabilis F]
MAAWDTVPDPLANNPRMQYLYNGKTESTKFEDLLIAEANDLGFDRQMAEERKQRTLAWIQDFVAQHPDGLIDNTFAPAQPSLNHLDINDDQQFPAPPAPKPAPKLPQRIKSVNASKLPIIKSSTATQKDLGTTRNNPEHDSVVARLQSPAHNSASSANKNTNSTTSSQRRIRLAAWNETPWNRPLKPWNAPENGHALSTSPPKSIGGSADSSANFLEQQRLLDQEIIDASHGPWKECRCEHCYEDNKGEYDQHVAKCEDCREEFFNHELFGGKLPDFW